MSSFWRRSLARTHGLRPLWIMFTLLALSEAILHCPPARNRILAATDALWLQQWLGPDLGQFMTAQQDLIEAPVNQAFIRAIRDFGAETKIVLVGDSMAQIVPALPPFYRRLEPILKQVLGREDLAVYSFSSVGQNHVSGFYLTKAILSAFPPDLILYIANPIHFASNRANLAPRDLGLVDTDFFSLSESKLYSRLVRESEAKHENRFPFRLARAGYQVLYGWQLRALLLPPAAGLGLHRACYRAECNLIPDIYWREQRANPEYLDPIVKTWKKIVLPAIGEQDLNFSFLMLTAELARSRGIPLIMIIPPKNFEFLELLGKRQMLESAGNDLERIFRARGVSVINCQHAVQEQYFRETQHLRDQGLTLWAEFLRPPLTSLLRQTGDSGVRP